MAQGRGGFMRKNISAGLLGIIFIAAAMLFLVAGFQLVWAGEAKIGKCNREDWYKYAKAKGFVTVSSPKGGKCPKKDKLFEGKCYNGNKGYAHGHDIYFLACGPTGNPPAWIEYVQGVRLEADYPRQSAVKVTDPYENGGNGICKKGYSAPFVDGRMAMKCFQITNKEDYDNAREAYKETFKRWADIKHKEKWRSRDSVLYSESGFNDTLAESENPERSKQMLICDYLKNACCGTKFSNALVSKDGDAYYCLNYDKVRVNRSLTKWDSRTIKTQTIFAGQKVNLVFPYDGKDIKDKLFASNHAMACIDYIPGKDYDKNSEKYKTDVVKRGCFLAGRLMEQVIEGKLFFVPSSRVHKPVTPKQIFVRKKNESMDKFLSAVVLREGYAFTVNNLNGYDGSVWTDAAFGANGQPGFYVEKLEQCAKGENNLAVCIAAHIGNALVQVVQSCGVSAGNCGGCDLKEASCQVKCLDTACQCTSSFFNMWKPGGAGFAVNTAVDTCSSFLGGYTGSSGYSMDSTVYGMARSYKSDPKEFAKGVLMDVALQMQGCMTKKKLSNRAKIVQSFKECFHDLGLDSLGSV